MLNKGCGESISVAAPTFAYSQRALTLASLSSNLFFTPAASVYDLRSPHEGQLLPREPVIVPISAFLSRITPSQCTAAPSSVL